MPLSTNIASERLIPYHQVHGTSNSSQVAKLIRTGNTVSSVPFSAEMRIKVDDNI